MTAKLCQARALAPPGWTGRSMNRRQFLRWQLKGALWLAAGSAGLCPPTPSHADALPEIAVVKGRPQAATRAAVDILGGMAAFVKSGDKVVIKPNMSFPNGVENATNTRPEVVRELVAMALEAGAARVRVLDHPLGDPTQCIAEIRDACTSIGKGITHALTDSDLYRPVQMPELGYGFNRTDVMRDVLSADCLIAAPTAKSHHMTGVSLSIKGMMGLVYDRWAMHRQGIDGAVVSLAAFLKPKLVVVDASRILATNGPRGPGEIIPMHTIIASADMVAADAQTVQIGTWYGKRFQAAQIQHIRMAHEKKLGRMDVENLVVRQATV